MATSRRIICDLQHELTNIASGGRDEARATELRHEWEIWLIHYIRITVDW